MPCVILTLGLFIPRLLAVLLFFTGWFSLVFGSILWPILGIIFMPTTLIWFGFVHHYLGGNWGLVAIGGLVIAVLIDVGPAAGQRKTKVAE
jgi:hypothetical protein